VAATLDLPEGRVAIGTGLEAAANGDGEGTAMRRIVRIDGRNAQSQLALGQHVVAIWLTPLLDGLWTGGPGDRRRFLDRMVAAFDPNHAGSVAAYEQAMRQRARLLAEGKLDPHWLSALEDTMARHGVALTVSRLDLVARLDQAARLGVGPFPRAALALSGEVEGWVSAMAALDAEDRLRERLAAQRRVDADSGTTTIGPHRCDLVVRHLDRDIPVAGRDRRASGFDQAGGLVRRDRGAGLAGLDDRHGRRIVLNPARARAVFPRGFGRTLAGLTRRTGS
jgi:DNA replication and repair protein RecF